MGEATVGCGRPTGSVVGEKPQPKGETVTATVAGEVKMTARVGAKAPDFEAPAYLRGKFMNVKLSDYLGKWVMICFYPGDFTFV